MLSNILCLNKVWMLLVSLQVEYTCTSTHTCTGTHTHTHTHTQVHVHIHTLTTAPVTQSGDSMLVLSVREGKLDVIKYFVSEQGVDINGEFTG